jgi:hypothetical protein
MKKIFLVFLLSLTFILSYGQTPIIGAYNHYVKKSSAPAAFTPSSLTNVVFWGSADSTGLSDNDPISTWFDKSGHGINAIAGSGQEPILKTNVLNGKSGVKFSGGQYFDIALGSITQPYTFFVLIKFDNLGGTNMYAIDGMGGNVGILSNAGGTNSVYMYAGGGLINPSVTNTNWNYFCYNYNGGSSLYSINGVETGPVSPGTASFTNITVGRYGGGGIYLSGYILDFVYQLGTATPSERANMYTYYQTKYGL